MRIDCPHGFKTVSRLGSITIEARTVNIYDGICDRPDLCGIERCEFYDISREGHHRFLQALYRSKTLEGKREERELRSKGLG